MRESFTTLPFYGLRTRIFGLALPMLASVNHETTICQNLPNPG